MAKESLQRAAIARIAAGKRSKNVRRHSLDRLHASMIKQKKNHVHRWLATRQWGSWVRGRLAEWRMLGVSKTTWAVTMKSMTLSAPPLQGHWPRPQDARRLRRGSPFSPMPRLPSDAWPGRRQVLDRSMRYRHGAISQHCGRLAQASTLRFVGAHRARASQGTRRLTGGRRWQRPDKVALAPRGWPRGTTS